MELGPIQKKWVEDLIAYAHRQIGGELGRKEDDGSIRACCLGQALLSYCEIKEIEPNFIDSTLHDPEFNHVEYWLKDFGDTSYMEEDSLRASYEKLGLKDPQGKIDNEEGLRYNAGETYFTLAEANDAGVPWLAIAQFIIKNPKAVFNESL